MPAFRPKTFLTTEIVAISADWVLLFGALVGLALAVVALTSTGMEDLSGDMSGKLTAEELIEAEFSAEEPSPSPGTDPQEG